MGAMSGEQSTGADAAPTTSGAATAPAEPQPSQRFLTILVFVCGSASLGGEIASLRLLAPFFGASTIVWANTIAVVLLALSLGYFLGGRLADRHPHLRGLCSMIGVAALLYAIVPIVASPFLRVSVKLVDASSFGTLAGSLLSVVVLVALPMTLLGAVSPWALRLALRDVVHSGSVAGRLYAISTAGSLVGIMLATLVLIPFTGSRRTFFVFAIALAVIAAIGIARARYIAVPLAIAVAGVLPIGPLQPGTTPGDRVLYEGETPFQYVRVVESRAKDVFLELNQSSAIHSMYRPGSYLTGGNSYWDHVLVLPLASLDAPPERVAILGNAAGTMARSLGHFYPDAHVDGVEIDPKLTELGERFFDMRNPKLRVFHEDARPWLERSDGDYDLIVMDAYQPEYIPFYLATKEFFELTRDRLSGNGLFILNIDQPADNDELEKVLGRTMSEAFPNIRRRAVSSTTTLLLGSKSDIDPQRMRDSAEELDLPTELLNLATPTAVDLGPRLEGGEVFTDDKAPVEWLVDLSQY
jgi:spermidine synthase